MAAFKARLYTARTRKAARTRRRRLRKKGHNKINIARTRTKFGFLRKTAKNVNCLHNEIFGDVRDSFCVQPISALKLGHVTKYTTVRHSTDILIGK